MSASRVRASSAWLSAVSGWPATGGAGGGAALPAGRTWSGGVVVIVARLRSRPRWGRFQHARCRPSGATGAGVCSRAVVFLVARSCATVEVADQLAEGLADAGTAAQQVLVLVGEHL